MLEDLADVLIDADEIVFKLGNKQVKLTNVYGGTLSDHCHEDVLTNLHLLHKVLVIHDSNLKLATRTELGELILEV